LKRALTDRLLRSLAVPSAAPVEVWDKNLLGFGIRISRTGKASFFAMRRQRGAGRPQAVRITIGTYPLIPLLEARQRARDLLRDLHAGIDPREREAERLRAEAAEKLNTFRAVAEEFINRHVARARTARSIELRIRRELIARWGDRPIIGISRRDVIEMIEEIVDDGRPAAAHATLAYTKKLFGWAIARDILEHAPSDRVSARDLIGAKRARQRVLTNVELALLWRATEGAIQATYPDGPFVRLLLMLGVRRGELAHAKFGEFDLDKGTWTLAGDRTKNADPLAIPLPKAAIEILRMLPRFDSGHVFAASRGAGPVNSFDAIKERLDERLTALNGGKSLEPFTFHDLRRTFRTGLSTLGVAPHIAELCIGHRQRGVSAIYDRHRFERERRDAMERWATHLHAVVDGLPANVVPLRG
jgi:integrase